MNNQKIKLYWNLGSQPARSVKAILNIGKISHQSITKDVVKQQTRSNQYLQLNPMGQIPFLTHGKLKIAQSNAILVYLCQSFNSIPKHYYGQTPQQRAKTNQYLSWYQYYFRPALFKIISLKIYGFVRKNKPFKTYQLNSAKKQMIEAIKTLQQLLRTNGTKFITGNLPTIADLQIYFELTNMIVYNQKFDQFKLVTKWYQQVQNISEVNEITKSWVPVSKFVAKTLASIHPQDQPKSKL